jgi:hypothetical protein
MKLKITFIAGTAVLAILISGCAGTPELDENWGRAFEEAKVIQTLNPDASGNLEPVEGLQGPVVEKILNDRLQGEKSNKEQSSGFGVVTLK